MKNIYPDPEIHIKKTAFMQRVQDYVRTGHTRYVLGQISLEKVRFFGGKFDRLYSCFMGKLDASRARAAGLYTARMLLWRPDDADVVHWILLVLPLEMRRDDEDGVEREARHWLLAEAGNQKWRDATVDRISITGFELVRLTKTISASERQKNSFLKRRVVETEGDEKRKIEKALHRASVSRVGAGLGWTWRYRTDRYDELRESLIRAVRNRRDDELRRLIQVIWTTPGFSGSRAQVKKYRELLIGEWKRSRSKDPPPELPRNIGYVRRLESKTARASQLQRKAKRNED